MVFGSKKNKERKESFGSHCTSPASAHNMHLRPAKPSVRPLWASDHNAQVQPGSHGSTAAGFSPQCGQLRPSSFGTGTLILQKCYKNIVGCWDPYQASSFGGNIVNQPNYFVLLIHAALQFIQVVS
jgi:hypothetical protein